MYMYITYNIVDWANQKIRACALILTITLQITCYLI